MTNKLLRTAILIVCMSLTACATRLEPTSPSDIDISGSWILNPELSQEIILARAKSQSRKSSGQRPPKSGGGQREGRPNKHAGQQSGSVAGGKRPAKPDSMTSKQMTIEQNHDSMGIQYLDGNYRDVDWGKNEYRRNTISAGWKGETLMVITKGNKLSFSEIYQLDPTKQVLYVTHEVAGESYVRVYERKPQSN